MIDALAADLLRRHVVERTHHHVAAGQLGGDEAGETEIENLDHAVIGDEDVGGLDVAVDDAVDVRVVEPFADIDRDVQLAAHAQLLRAGHALLQILPLEELHREVGLTLVLAEVVDGDDVAVRQLTGGPGLAEESFTEVSALVNRRRDHLDRHRPLQQRVVGAVHDTHPALSQSLEELIAAYGVH